MGRAPVVLLVGLLAVFLVDVQPGEGKQPDRPDRGRPDRGRPGGDFVPSKPKGGEKKMSGPRDLTAFVEEKGGGIRLFHEMPPPPGMRGRQKTGEILIRLGRIREIDLNGTESDMDDDDRSPTTTPNPQEERKGDDKPGGGQGQGPPQGQNDTSSGDTDDDDKDGRPRRPPWAGRPNETDFEVKNET